MKFSYDRSYSPAAPVVNIQIGVPGEAVNNTEYPAFIDTGADGTIIPSAYLRQFDIEPDSQRYLRSQWGDRRTVDVYLMDIVVNTIHLSPVEIVADELGNEIILGRNVLNQLIITLDGPDNVFEILH
jgi:predicted aspartyl protease